MTTGKRERQRHCPMPDLGRVQITHGQTGKGRATLMEALHLAQSLMQPPRSGTLEPTPRLIAGIEEVLSEHNARASC
ncbi:hypothetical protein ACFWIA_18420 [Streptomyces sp. NPDC127068]|uniref:hypothetical protein n=1 Tax=Streptomyces sp. NPDC127068 TaxID=3347127 RepID=UPI0036528ED3